MGSRALMRTVAKVPPPSAGKLFTNDDARKVTAPPDADAERETIKVTARVVRSHWIARIAACGVTPNRAALPEGVVA